MKTILEQLKIPLITVVCIFIGLFIYTKLAGPIPFFINSVNTTQTDLFTSNGQGQVTAVPDTATINVGVTQTSANVSDAKDKTDATVNKIIAAVKKLGISDKDIKTTNYSISPNYTPGAMQPMIIVQPPGRGNIVSYTVTQNLEIKIKPTDKANSVIDAVSAEGANLVGGISFTFSDDLQNKLEDQARQIAVNDAKSKAQSLANAAGIHLGRLLNVVENSNLPRVVMPLSAGSAETNQTETSTNVTPGENTVSVDVTLYYQTY